MTSTGAPRVSICIPTYNAGRWVESAVSSALGQTFDEFEVLVVDNASTDDTVERARAFDDERVTIIQNPVNIGAPRNFNKCIELARGPLVKFLHADDQLYPECLARMVELISGEPSVGIVFSPRDVILADPDDPVAVSWAARYGLLHEPLGEIGPVTSGRDVFRRWLEVGVHENLIGEPTVVLIRRECFERVGSFDPRLTIATDIEMWLRILLAYDLGFVPEPLSAFRHHSESITGQAARSSAAWLDDLMVIDSLLACDLDSGERREVLRARAAEKRRVRRALAGRVVRRVDVMASIRDYAGWRFRQSPELKVDGA